MAVRAHRRLSAVSEASWRALGVALLPTGLQKCVAIRYNQREDDRHAMDRFRCRVRALRKRGTHYDERSSDRYERASVALTSNLAFAQWTQVFGNEQMTAALLDRLVHRSHILTMEGESFRFRQSLQKHDPSS